MTKQSILVVDDDASIAEILEYNLKGEGLEVRIAHSGEEALALQSSQPSSLILLDVMMGGISGYKVAEELRKRGDQTPIIFLTARDSENDMLTGFSVGGDDYISKPFSLKEVSARVKAVLKRSEVRSTPTSTHIYECAGLRVDFEAREVWIEGELLPLTRTETELLILLTRHADQVLSRASIIDSLWSETPYITERTVDVHITRLRKKLGTRYATALVNRQGYGYKFAPSALCD